MDKKKATDFIQKLLVSNEDKKPDSSLEQEKVDDDNIDNPFNN